MQEEYKKREGESRLGKRANNLDGKQWLKNSLSVWRGPIRSPEERQLGHPAVFPVELVKKIIDSLVCISPDNAPPVIFDPFGGTATTLVAALEKGISGVGFELGNGYWEKGTRRLRAREGWEVEEENPNQLVLSAGKARIKWSRGDARELGKTISPGSVNLTVTSPPYWDIMSQKRTADGRNSRPYSNDKNDFSNIKDYGLFLQDQSLVFSRVFASTKMGGYLVVVVMDLRKGKDFYPLHIDYCRMLQEVGFTLDDIIIWDRSQEYNNLRPLGYPSVFRVNKVHEYLLIFQRR